jgi:hypothetical protein
MSLDFVSCQYGCLFSRCRKYVINSLIHGHFHIGLVIIAYLYENFNLNNNLTRGATNLLFLVPSENTCNKNSFVYIMLFSSSHANMAVSFLDVGSM